LLQWQTAQESNTSHFILERSFDGNLFSNIAQVAASGNSVSTKKYQYTDAVTVNTIIYYRLITVDADGKRSYSPVLKIQMQPGKALTIYPTVVNSNSIYIITKNSLPAATILMYNQQGQLMHKQLLGQLAANQTSQVLINKEKIGAGQYNVVLQSGNKTIYQQRILIQ